MRNYTGLGCILAHQFAQKTTIVFRNIFYDVIFNVIKRKLIMWRHKII